MRGIQIPSSHINFYFIYYLFILTKNLRENDLAARSNNHTELPKNHRLELRERTVIINA